MDYETNKIISQEELNKMGEELSNYAESLINQQFKKISNDMDYEKKYKEANDKVAARFGTNVAKEIFTDLYESEDERIRKGIISGMKALQEKGKYTCFANIPMDKVFAWLEKQGSEPNWCHHKVDLSNCSEEYRKAYYDGWNNCNQQHSQCKSEWNDVVKCLINGMKFYYEDNEEATWGTEKFSMKVKDILAWLEKQAEQKSVDKAEPKFKVKYAGSEYNVFETKDIAGVTFYGIEDEPNHIDYVKADNCEIISGGYGIKENGSPYPTKPAVFSEQKSADKIESITQSYIIPNSEFFQWIYDRLIYVHHENPNVDYMLSLKKRIEDMQNPINDDMKEALQTEYEKGRADTIAEIQKHAWSEKDEKEYKYVLKFVDNILNNCGNKKDYEHCKRCYD